MKTKTNVRRMLLLTVILMCHCFFASSYSLIRQNLPLANNAVLSIYQDEKGYMWFGTYDGLHSYNGKDTEVFRMELNNELSLASNIVVKLAPSGKDFIWVSTSMGLSRFSISGRTVTETYMQYKEVYHIASDDEGNTVLVSTDGIISVYAPKEHTFHDVPTEWLKVSDVVTIWSPSKGQFCILSQNGAIWKFSISEQNPASLLCKSNRTISSNQVKSAVCEGGTLYFVDSEAKMWRLDEMSSGPMMLSDLSELGEAGRTVSDICSFAGNLFVGFYAGALARIPSSGGRCEVIATDYRIFCLEKDRNQDILWIGTDGYGVFMYCDKPAKFNEMLMSDLPLNIKKPVRGIYTDKSGALWLSTKGDGVIVIPDYESYKGTAADRSRVCRYMKNEGLGSNEAYAFCPSTDGSLLWIGTSGKKLSYYSYQTRKFGTVDADLAGVAVHNILSVGENSLLVASDTEGLVRIDYSMKNSVPHIEGKTVFKFKHKNIDCNNFYAMVQDSDSTLLIGLKTGYGLVRFNINDGTYDFPDMSSLQSRALGDILSLSINPSKELFCGSSAGLIRLFRDGRITKYDRTDGLMNDMIHGVLQDDEGAVWLSTNKGLVQFSPKTETFHNYSSNELSIIEFSDDAYWKCPNTGRLFFGGVNGVVWMEPKPVSRPTYHPDVIFETISASDDLTLRIEQDASRQIVLPNSVTRFTVSFVAIDYLDGDNYEYSYSLDGFSDNAWTELYKSNCVTFSGLAPGKYTLNVRYRKSATDSETGQGSLSFRILPPWYASLPALVIYLLLIVVIVYLIVFWTRRHYTRKQQRILAQTEEEHRKRLDKARMDFFVNVSHELCTPMTLINGITEHIRDSLHSNPEYRKHIDILSANVADLRELVEEILDFRRIEEDGFGKPRIRPENVSSSLAGYVSSFDEMAVRCRISLKTSIQQDLVWNTDKSFFKKIVFNLVSNAIKYTPEGGSILVSAQQEDDKLVLKVRNSGEGMSREQMDVVFDRYRILDEIYSSSGTVSHTRHGLGLYICQSLVDSLDGEIKVESTRGEYTEFIVRLPSMAVDAELNEGSVRDGFDESFTPSPASSSQHFSVQEDDDALPVVLVVDDNRDIRWLLKKSFSKRFKVVECSNAAQAESMMENLTPALIITDVVMEGRNEGFDLVRKLRSDRYHKGIPVIICSAMVTEQDQIAGMASGADAYFTKPFSVSVLTATAERLVSNRRLLKDYFDTPESARTIVGSQVMHSADKAFLDSVIGLLKDKLSDQNFNLDVLADHLGLSVRNFSRRFKKITGKTPNEFIKRYRFEYAASLLKNTDKTVQEVMYAVGLSNKSYFYREFCLLYNMTPKEYRDSFVRGE